METSTVADASRVPSLHLHRITRLNDPALRPWFDLFQDAFPLTEQVRVSSVIKTIAEIEAGESEAVVMAVQEQTDDAPTFAGMIWYEPENEETAFLWYLAVAPEKRGAGLGSRVYRMLGDELRAAGVRILVYEIEHPDDPHADPEMSLRRRGFYTRNGARCAENVPYTQSVGWQPPVRMWLMAHALADDVTTDDLTAAIYDVFANEAGPVDAVEWK